MLRSADIYVTSDIRRAALRRLLAQKKCLRILETHSPISALIAQNTTFNSHNGDGDGDNEIEMSFDGFWSSSLTDSTERGRPDIEALDIQNRLSNIHDIFEVTTKPLLMDGDTGGRTEHFILNIRSLERIGVSAVIIEDKTGLKKNSLLGNDVFQLQETIKDFCYKISSGKEAQITNDFMIIARVKSLVLEAGMDDAIERSLAYVGAGADGIMIHSRRKTSAEVMEFADRFRSSYPEIPLICVPTSYSETYFTDFERAGFNVIIYANHLLRSSYSAMRDVAVEILKRGRTFEIEPKCLAIDEILRLIPGTF